MTDVLDNVYSADEGKQVTVLSGLYLHAVCSLRRDLPRDIIAAPVGRVQCAVTTLSWIQSYLGLTQFVKLGQHQSSDVKLMS